MKYAIGVDLGGTHVAASPVDDRGRVYNVHSRELESHDVKYVVGEVARVVTRSIESLPKSAKVAGVGIGSPGNIEQATGTVRFSPNFDWHDVPLRQKLEKKLARPVHILNDARCATIGEYHYGVGKGARDFVLVTLGTGIGGGIIANGKLVLGHAMGAGEIGHHVIRAGTGFVCTCGKIGCFEVQASGTALLRHALALAPSFPRSTLLTGTPQVDWGSKMISRAAAAGDQHALATWNSWLRDLATGLANVIAFVNPEIIALGGGVGRTDDSLLATPLTRLVDEQTTMVPKHQTAIVRAKLGNNAGIVGSASLVLHGIP
ncbi:MAG: ROK family protein [Candidatus Eremiobacteraeota bacterium]|nr:ROK family protein [Candidatus Eremiobacteraeota bacterium]MBV8366270.1 ROK family protein [Candidatus Eremiobacteraeota bacterium]